MGFRLPTEANFNKLITSLKGKHESWGHKNLSLTGRILVTNQVLLASMWYLVACWDLNPHMCSHIRRVVRNFIWEGKATNVRAKVKWDILTLSTLDGGLRIINPKVQSEALLAKLLVRGLAPRGEPWKELLRHRVDQTRLHVHNGGPQVPDINCSPKTQKTPPLIPSGKTSPGHGSTSGKA